MSDTTDLMGARVEETAAAPATDASAPATGAGSRRRRGTGLDGMVLAELQQVASGLGIKGTARMRKSQLIEVIKEAQAGGGAAAPKAASSPDGDAAETKPKRRATSKARTGEAAEKKAETGAEAPAEKAVAQQQIEIPGQPAAERGGDDAPTERRRRRATAEAGAPAGSPETVAAEAKSEPKAETPAQQPQGDAGDGEGRGRRDRRDRGRDRGERGDRDRGDRRKSDDQQGGGRQDRQQQNQQQGGGRQDRQQRDNGPQDDDDFEGGRRGRRGRYRDRRGRRGRDEMGGPEPQINEDDVLIPVAGILDILDNYAFIRTSGYLPGPNDVYVSLAQVRKNGLRKGDHITGAVRQPQGRRAAREVQRAGPPGLRQRHGARTRPRPPGVQQADPAVPAGPPPPGDGPRCPHHPHHRPRRADR
ncbi:hypothetical protein M2161_006397 [Streptomyces sp. SAI-133]|nr:hypothetical protein [Streptomyces sp. SAI-133]